MPFYHFYRYPIFLNVQLGLFVFWVGATIYYAESIDTVARDLLVAKPTFIISVPRLYEKIYQKVIGNAKGAKKSILNLALFIGRSFSERSFMEIGL